METPQEVLEKIIPERSIIFDSQMLNAVQLCAARYFYEFEMNLRTPHLAQPIEEGDMVHVMFEHLNKVKIHLGGDFQDQFEKAVEYAVKIGEKHSTTLELPPAEIQETIYQFTEAAKYYRRDGYQTLAAEVPFLLPLNITKELGIYYTGKIDHLCITPEQGKAVEDYKTMRRKSMPYVTSNQFTGYAMAANVDWVIVNKIGFQTSLKPHERFLRYPLFYTQHMKDRWKENTIWWGKQLAFFLENDTWPENRTSCDKYNGCPYLPITSATTHEAKLWKMKSEFKVVPEWDPTNVLRKGKEEQKQIEEKAS